MTVSRKIFARSESDLWPCDKADSVFMDCGMDLSVR